MRLSEKNVSVKWRYLFVAPIVVLAVFTTLYMINGMYPFGKGTVVWCDMNQQVVPLLLQFKDMLAGKGSVMYSFAAGGGMNFWAVFLFFLCSPFSLLTAIIDKSDMLGAMNILVALKLTVCAFTAGVFFKYSQKSLHPYFVVMLSLLYAFCGYGMLFYQNMMWLDMMYLFPLLLLSFERIIYFQKPFLYIISMSVMVIVNFYIGYMVVLFTILFFGVYALIVKIPKKRRVIAIFAGSSLISALITAVIWLPALVQYLNSGRGAGLLESLFSSSLFGYPETTISMLLCSTIMFVVILFALIKKEIKNKQQIIYGILLIFTLIPIFLDPVNKMWHTGDYMCFPARYGFMTIFVGLALTGTLLSKIEIEKVKTKKSVTVALIAAAAVLAALSVFYYKTFYEYLISYVSTLWGSVPSLLLLLLYFVVFGAFYFLLYSMLRLKKLSLAVFAVVVSIALITEICFNSNVYIVSAKESTDYNGYEQMVDLDGKINDDSFYRVSTDEKRFAVNYLAGISYNSLSHYTSLTSRDFLLTSKRLGFSTYWMEVGGYGGTYLTDALLSIKYNIKDKADDGAIYANQSYEIVPNEYFLPTGLLTDTDLSSAKELDASGRADIQQYLYQTLFNTDKNLIENYEPTKLVNCKKYVDSNNQMAIFNDEKSQGTINYSFHVDGTQTLYFDCYHESINDIFDEVNDSLQVLVNNKLIKSSFPQKENNGLLCLGTFTDEDVKVKLNVLKTFVCDSFGVFGMNNSLLDDAVNNAETVDFNIEDNKYVGNVSTESEKSVFFAVPYDKSFTVKINGEKVDYYKTMSDYIGFDLPKGDSKIEISYMPAGMKTGAVISVFGAALLILFLYIYKKKKFCFRKGDNFGKISSGIYIIYCGVFYLTVIAVYLFPMIIFVLQFFV